MSEKIASEKVVESNSHSLTKAPSLDSENAALSDVTLPSNATSIERTAFLASFTSAEEKRIMRKVDFRLLFLMPLMLMVKNIDTGNAALVKVLQVGESSNVLRELHMTTDEYNWVQSSYYIAYLLFELPSALLLKRVSPRHWLTRIIFTWGAVLACHAAVSNKQGLWSARFFLGLMEAGLWPAICTHAASWYRSDEMGRPFLVIGVIGNCSGVFGALLAYGISYMNGLGGLSAWRWVYLLEGLATIVFSGFVYFLLPDYPKSSRTAKWLTQREQDFVEARLSENAPKTADKFFTKEETIRALKDIRVWSFMASQTFVNIAGYGLTWFLPTIITSLGFAGLPRNQLLNIPPVAATVLAILILQWFINRAWLLRPIYSVLLSFGQVITFVIFLSTTGRVGIYIACILGNVFWQTYFNAFWVWRSSTLQGSTGTPFTLGLQNSVGQIGGVIGPQLFQAKWAANNHRTSFSFCLGAAIIALVANLLTFYLTRNVEYDVLRVHRLRKKANKLGTVLADDDIKVFQERQFFSKGLTKSSLEVKT